MGDSSKWNCFVFEDGSEHAIAVSREKVAEALKAGHLVWCNVLAPSREDIAWMKKIFGFHELALSDVMNNAVRPKQETYGDVLFTVFRAINLNPGEEALDTINLNLFLTKQFLVTAHLKPLRTIQNCLERVSKNGEVMSRGMGFLYYTLLDGIVDRYLDVIDGLEDEIDELEDQVFEKLDKRTQMGIFDLKKRVTNMRRLIFPEREALTSLVHSSFPQIDETTRTYLRDVLDHVLRVQDLCESYRDLLLGLMDSYMTQISNHMNEVMKLLSIIATVMLPLGFLTGLFGMNFDFIPMLHWAHGFWALILFMIVMVSFMFWAFKKKNIL